MSRETSLLPPFISPRNLARWPVRLLVLTIAVAWVAVGVDLHDVWLLVQALRGTEVDAALRQGQFDTTGWMFWIQGILGVVTGIAFISWLYQARINVRALGMRRMRYGRGWCIWGFLTPVLNIFRPYQVVREIWKASDPTSLDPFQWKSRPTPSLVGLWWGSFLIAAGLRVLAVLTNVGADVNLQKLVLSGSLTLLADTALAVAAAASIFILTRLSNAQETKWALKPDALPDGPDPVSAV